MARPNLAPGIIAVLLLLALLPRLLLLAVTNWGIESDEAIVGLMAKHILQGGSWPVFYYGQHYMGSLEAFLSALVFSLFGASNFSLKLMPLLFSLIQVGLVYSLALRFSDRRGAFIAALLTALAPSSLIVWSSKARGGFIELVVIGSLALLLSVDLLQNRRPEKQSTRIFLLGFFLGLGWWVNNQIVFYMLPIGLIIGPWLFLRQAALSALSKASLGLIGFFLGGFPFWYANYTHDPRWPTFDVLFGKSAGGNFNAYLEGYFSTALPIILGAKRFWANEAVFFGAVPLVYLLLFLGFGIAALAFMRREERREGEGLSWLLLGLFFVTVPLVFSKSSFGWLSQAPRYLLPLYSMIFIPIGAGISFLYSRSQILSKLFGGLLLASMLGVHLASNYLGGVAAEGQPMVYRGERVVEDQEPLYAWMRAQGYRHMWTNYWVGYRAAFETGEEISFTRFGRPRSLRIPEYERLAKEKNFPLVYVLVPTEALEFERELKQFGRAFRRSEIGGYVVLDQITPLFSLGKRIEVRPDMLRSNAKPEAIVGMVDGDAATRWGSGKPQEPNMQIEIVLDQPKRLSSLVLDFGAFVHDAPRHLVVDLENEAGAWERVFDSQGTKVYSDLSEQEYAEIPQRWEIRFPARKAKRVRLTELLHVQVYDWSIAEIELYEEP